MVDTFDKRSGRIGIDISTSMLRAVSLDASGVVSASLSKSVDTRELAVEQLVTFIKEVKAEWGEFERLGVSVPGLVDRRSQRVAFSIHIPEHSAIDIDPSAGRPVKSGGELQQSCFTRTVTPDKSDFVSPQHV